MSKTMSDIAKEANVSQSTVSRYFNKPELLSAESRTAIENAITKIGFVENKIAKSLASGESNLIGIILPQLKKAYFPDILSKIISTAEKKGYLSLVYIVENDKDKFKLVLNELNSYNIKFVINLSNNTIMKSEPIVKKLKILNIENTSTDDRTIKWDNFGGGKLAVDLLYSNNCDYIIHFNDSTNRDKPGFDRVYGARTIQDKVEYKEIIDNELLKYDNLSKYIDDILKTNKKKLGFFCSNDEIAIHVLNYCIRKGLNILTDFEVIGYDNSIICKRAIYKLTSIGHNYEKIINEVFANEKLINFENMIVEPEIHNRETTIDLK